MDTPTAVQILTQEISNETNNIAGINSRIAVYQLALKIIQEGYANDADVATLQAQIKQVIASLQASGSDNPSITQTLLIAQNPTPSQSIV